MKPSPQSKQWNVSITPKFSNILQPFNPFFSYAPLHPKEANEVIID